MTAESRWAHLKAGVTTVVRWSLEHPWFCISVVAVITLLVLIARSESRKDRWWFDTRCASIDVITCEGLVLVSVLWSETPLPPREQLFLPRSWESFYENAGLDVLVGQTQFRFEHWSPGSDRCYEVLCPLAVLLLPFLPVLLVGGAAIWRQQFRRRHGLCVACGYDLRGTPEGCPECGRLVRRSRR